MQTLAIIQARMGSSRLPGKVLLPLGGKPVLQRVIERAQHLGADAVCVATTRAPADDATADLAVAMAVPYCRYGRGPEEANVNARFRRVLHRNPCDAFWRITADCPLFSIQHAREAMALLRHTGAPYVAATVAAGFVDGLDSEVLRTAAFLAAAPETDAEREHPPLAVMRRHPESCLQVVPPHFYAHPNWRLTLDTLRDYERLQAIWADWPQDVVGEVSSLDAVRWLVSHPEWRGNAA